MVPSLPFGLLQQLSLYLVLFNLAGVATSEWFSTTDTTPQFSTINPCIYDFSSGWKEIKLFITLEFSFFHNFLSSGLDSPVCLTTADTLQYQDTIKFDKMPVSITLRTCQCSHSNLNANIPRHMIHWWAAPWKNVVTCNLYEGGLEKQHISVGSADCHVENLFSRTLSRSHTGHGATSGRGIGNSRTWPSGVIPRNSPGTKTFR